MVSAAQLLVVSPDATVLRSVERAVLALGHTPHLARSLREAQRFLIRVEVDLLCFDSLLSASRQERLWRWLGGDQSRALPVVLFLAPPAARSTPALLPAFYRPERDGLVTKPLRARELTREVARLLARRSARPEEADVIQRGPLTLDGAAYQLYIADAGALPLTRTEYRLVRYLMQRSGEFVPPEELLEQVWGYPQGTGSPEVVRSHVSNLRRKLRRLGQDPQVLRTVPYRGYGIPLDFLSSAPS